ncbi:serine/threonine-protein kinase ATM-like isoform X2 [Lotus japonicus]|uniref:serine/threonine-protein kinase ATM-like isoform X2 n=1 Tax=Lotus japonicus TaxID=34305 RepID=UPI00258BCA12|nr:serine/threonine-protein kinase ATM-like isoform X2 [Lotus japonicus]
MAMAVVQPTQGMNVDYGDPTKTTEKSTVTQASPDLVVQHTQGMNVDNGDPTKTTDKSTMTQASPDLVVQHTQSMNVDYGDQTQTTDKSTVTQASPDLVVQHKQGMNVDYGDQTKTTDKSTVTQASQKIRGCFDSRDRKKSKYLSYPYTTGGPRHKDLPAQSEEVKTPSLAKKTELPSRATNPSNGSASCAKLGSKRFRTNWHRKFISRSRMSSSPEFINASPKELLSELHSKAVDCMFPTENKSFELVEWFFSRYRISTYHDEAELATSLVDEKGGKTGKRVGSNLLDIKSGKRKNNKMESSVKRKTKSLYGLSNMNINTSTGDSLRLEINLNEGSSKGSSVTEAPQNLSCRTSKGKVGPKKRRKIEAPQDPQIASVYTDVKGTKCSSLVIDLRLSPHRPGVTLEKCFAGTTANHSLLVSTASEAGTVSQEVPIGNVAKHNFFENPASEGGTISQQGLVGNISKHRLFVSTTSEVGTVSVNKTELKSTVEKQAEEHHHTKNVTELPDLNGICTESDLIRKEVETVNVLTPGFRPGKSRSLSGCSRPSNTDRVVETNGESQPGTFLHLQFAPGAYIPSKDELLTAFYQFGPLKASESQLFKGTGVAQIVFVRSTDAGEAFHSLEKNKPFGTALVDYKLHHLPAAGPTVERLLTPTQPTKPVPVQVPAPVPVPVSTPVPVPVPVPVPMPMPLPVPGEAPPPPLEFMKQQLQMMTSILENSGNNLSPQMKAKLDTEIKNLLRKVNSRAKSDP